MDSNSLSKYQSRLARALWIEIPIYAALAPTAVSRLARALWIEIIMMLHSSPVLTRRGSREPCGLKFLGVSKALAGDESRLARALWIEICLTRFICINTIVEARESLVD